MNDASLAYIDLDVATSTVHHIQKWFGGKMSPLFLTAQYYIICTCGITSATETYKEASIFLENPSDILA